MSLSNTLVRSINYRGRNVLVQLSFPRIQAHFLVVDHAAFQLHSLYRRGYSAGGTCVFYTSRAITETDYSRCIAYIVCFTSSEHLQRGNLIYLESVVFCLWKINDELMLKRDEILQYEILLRLHARAELAISQHFSRMASTHTVRVICSTGTPRLAAAASVQREPRQHIAAPTWWQAGGAGTRQVSLPPRRGG